MKTLSLYAVLLFSIFGWTDTFAQATLKDETIKVWGNCGMCKKVIEKAAKSAGAEMASWDEETKQLKVSYAADKTNSTKIQEAIAKSGYDTQDFTGDNKAYHKLPGCCHYERKAADASSVKKCCDVAGCGTDSAACAGKSCCKENTCCKHEGKKDGASTMKKCCSDKSAHCSKDAAHEGKSCCKDKASCSHDDKSGGSKMKSCCDNAGCGKEAAACTGKDCCKDKNCCKS